MAHSVTPCSLRQFVISPFQSCFSTSFSSICSYFDFGISHQGTQPSVGYHCMELGSQHCSYAVVSSRNVVDPAKLQKGLPLRTSLGGDLVSVLVLQVMVLSLAPRSVTVALLQKCSIGILDESWWCSNARLRLLGALPKGC